MVPVGLDVATSNITRICDYLLGGKDNFAVGREPAGKLIAMMPRLPPIARDKPGVRPPGGAGRAQAACGRGGA